MTPADLVRQNVLSKAAIYFWLDDTAKPDKVRADSVSKVCKALRINREWLLTGRGGMDATSEPQSQSQSLKLDPVILAESIAACRSLAKRQGWDYDPQFNADVTCDAYTLRLLLPDAPSQTDVIDFGQKVAERLAREFGNGSDGGSGAGASTGGNDRGRLEAGAGTRKARAAGGSRGA